MGEPQFPPLVAGVLWWERQGACHPHALETSASRLLHQGQPG